MARLSSLQAGVMVLLLSCIVIGVGMIVTHEIRETTITTGAVAYFENAENDTSYLLPYAGDGVRSSTLVVENGSSTVASGNYTLNSNGSIILTDAGNTTYHGENLTVTYDWGEDLATYGALNSTTTSIGDFVDWLPILVIALITALLIGLTIRIFSGSNKI